MTRLAFLALLSLAGCSQEPEPARVTANHFDWIDTSSGNLIQEAKRQGKVLYYQTDGKIIRNITRSPRSLNKFRQTCDELPDGSGCPSWTVPSAKAKPYSNGYVDGWKRPPPCAAEPARCPDVDRAG